MINPAYRSEWNAQKSRKTPTERDRHHDQQPRIGPFHILKCAAPGHGIPLRQSDLLGQPLPAFIHDTADVAPHDIEPDIDPLLACSRLIRAGPSRISIAASSLKGIGAPDADRTRISPIAPILLRDDSGNRRTS